MGKHIQRLYLSQWQGHYRENILAGILLALTLLPVAIAFSLIVHINPTIGLMSCGLMMCITSFIGPRVAMVSGPSSGISIIAAPLVLQHNIQYLFAATMVMGLTLLICALCRIDKLLNLIPSTVVMGFMNALGLLLLGTQLKYIFGISIATYVLAVVTCIVIYIASKTIPLIPGPLVGIIVITLVAQIVKPHIQYVYHLAHISMILPHPQIPEIPLSFQAIKSVVLFGMTMALISMIQTRLTQEMLDNLTSQTTNKRKELSRQGIANIVVGFVGGYGSSGLVGQSKFNLRMGATTRLSMLVTGVFLLICVIILGPVIGHIPMVVLAIVLVSVSLNTFDRRTIAHIKEAPVKHSIIMLITMVLILVTSNLAVGVIVGSIVYYIWHLITKKIRSNTKNS